MRLNRLSLYQYLLKETKEFRSLQVTVNSRCILEEIRQKLYVLYPYTPVHVMFNQKLIRNTHMGNLLYLIILIVNLLSIEILHVYTMAMKFYRH